MTRMSMLLIVMFVAMKLCFSSKSPLLAAYQLQFFQNPVQNGKKIYEQTCLPCHQVDGSGVPGMNPPLINSVYVQGPANRLIGIVLHGLNDGVEIEGEAYSNPMPAFATVLTDGEVANVLTYLRNHFSNMAGQISPSQVRRVRQNQKN
jgi:mono/diheme cytochrome c family protein